VGGVGGRRTQSARPDGARKPKLRDALHLGAAIKLVWRAAPSWTVLNVALAVVQGILPLFAVYLMKLIVDAVTQGITATDHAAARRM
jgi:ATP-binding cassette subfamily B protein